MKDVLGNALKDYINGNKEGKITVHCSHTEEEQMDVSYFFRDWDNMPGLEKTAVQLAKGKVLDVGAGAGCHSRLMQETGLEVTALEKSKGACDVMSLLGIKFLNHDLFELKEEKYDTILMLMNGIGIAGTLGKLELLLRKLKNNLEPNGQIILDSSDICYLFMDEEGGQWIDINAHYYGELRYRFEYNGEISEEFDWLFIDQKKLMEIADRTGLDCQIIKEGEHYDYLARLTLKIN